MSEKTTEYVADGIGVRWRKVGSILFVESSNLNAQRLAAYLNALTSERDEAVREATEANERAAAADWLHGALLRDVDCTETSGLADEFLRRMMRIDNGETPNLDAVRVAGELRAAANDLRKHLEFVLAMTRYEDHSNGVVYQGMDEGEVISSRIIADADEAVARYASLTASTGGSSEGPQKEIRE